jgi:hypothetical protein
VTMLAGLVQWAQADLAAVDALALVRGVVPCWCASTGIPSADPAARRLPGTTARSRRKWRARFYRVSAGRGDA